MPALSSEKEKRIQRLLQSDDDNNGDGEFLDLRSVGVGLAGIWLICHQLTKENDSTRITKLDLSYNNITDEDCKAIEELLKFNTSLRALYLRCNEIGDKGVELIANGLQYNTTLSRLSLSWNQFGDTGFLALGEMLKVNNSLRELHLEANKISDEGIQAISDGLQVNRNLIALTLSKSRISKGCRAPQKIQYHLAINKASRRTLLDTNFESITNEQVVESLIKIRQQSLIKKDEISCLFYFLSLMPALAL